MSKVVKFLIAAAGVSLAVALLEVIPTTQNDSTRASVMVLAPNGRSGGTGIVLTSADGESRILTNNHVCHLVEKGGYVESMQGTSIVTSYKNDPNHDLCIITVNNNLGINTRIATRPPRPYLEKASISGHPSLLPNVITTGHFSGDRTVPVLAGFAPCESKDYQGQFAFLCTLFGVKPIVKIYDATLVTATIMPGSSGSGVYNEDGDLAGVAFAGSGDLGYAWTVPYQAMVGFLNTESKIPATNVGVLDAFAGEQTQETTDFANIIKEVRSACQDPSKAEQLGENCEVIQRNLLWVK